jgi:flagellin
MTSINTNFAAMTALQSLNATNKALEQTQSRISTGLRVGEAKDNASYWSIATTMRSDNNALGTVSDALGLSAGTVDTAYTGINSSIEIVDEIKQKLMSARSPSMDRAKIQSEISQLQEELKGMADSATFSGENWLSVDSSPTGYNATKSVVSSFSRSGSTISIGTIDIDTTTIKLYDANTAAGADGILDGMRGTDGALSTTGTFSIASLDISTLTDSTADIATLESYIAAADAAMNEMTDAATVLGAASKRIDIQKDFVSSLRDAIDRGISNLVDADMSAESTRLQALQVQQQLGVQSLSIANASSQTILSLFRS